MDIKDKKVIAIHALETARLALHPPFVCKDMDCTDCPFYTDKGECISVVISGLVYKVRGEFTMKNKLSTQSIAIAYAQREKRRLRAIQIIYAQGWAMDFWESPYQSPVTYLRHRHGITWKQYYPAWGGIMYTKFGM